ncbi:Protein of unknown function [Colwellia chukchiensis]|uniref:Beta-barrel porin 2 n=1 Tax=Colwellia chukchiensis TaxID=641665 RepID=A0A1H7TXK0_9GAMM|nr:surface lipoprotein assembly modifier [Colwellia chukchiensis]SEL89570.1 Protein of unknown function [Colwellia chukchiensis]
MKNYHGVIELTESLSQSTNISLALKQAALTLNRRAQEALARQSLYVQHAIDASLGYDSNVNAGTSEDNIFLPLLNQDIILSDNSKETSDGYLGLGYNLLATKALTQSSKLTFSAASRLHFFTSNSEYNRFYLTTNVQYNKDFAGFSSSIGVRAVPLWLNDSYYRTQYGATLGLRKALDKQWLVSSEIFVGQTKNDINKLLSTDDISLQIATQYLTQSWRHTLSLRFATEDSEFLESQHNNRETLVMSYLADFAINSHWLASANISFQQQDYQNNHPFFFEKRADDMWLIGGSIQYQDQGKWSYRLGVTMQDKDSNLTLFSYQRVDIQLSARMSF